MKSILATIAGLFVASSSFASTLQCWEVNFSKVATPFMTATIKSNTTLSDIKFLYKNANQGGVDGSEQNTLGTIKGKIETSVHSPYKGDVKYSLQNGDTLILPANLANAYLQSIRNLGVGLGAGENGVIIGFSSDGEGGGHYSYRLLCQSDKSL